MCQQFRSCVPVSAPSTTFRSGHRRGDSARHHPAFVAELNRRKVERAENLATRTDLLTTSALEIVQRAVQEGDLSAALAWMRLSHGSGRQGSHEASQNSAPLTALAVIDGSAQTIAFNETVEVMVGMYREDALSQIQEALDA